MSDKPNPGSNAAIALGCTCPVLDNNHGKFPPSPPDGWWRSGDCLVHSSVHAHIKLMCDKCGDVKTVRSYLTTDLDGHLVGEGVELLLCDDCIEAL